MNTALITKINWTKLVMVLTLLCSTLSCSATAQTSSDKPLDSKTLAVLITELKEVVSKMEPDEKNSALIAQKWDARNDLTGKTKTQVINLLYEDVKSVIKDSGKQYQIYSTFSMYKRMPDDQFSDKPGSKQINSSKKELVEKLVDLVGGWHPYVNIEEQLEGLPGTNDIKAEEENARKVRIEVFDETLKVNNKLTPDQKAFVKANYERLSKMADEIIDTAMKLNFPTEQWIQEGMEKIFSEKFSVKEINDLIAFFDSDKGGQVLNYVRQTNMAEIITGNGGKPDFTAADLAEHDKFVATALGKKFIAAYITETIAFEQRKEGEVRRNVPNADGFALLEPANLNKFFNQFVAENYKK